MKANPSTIEPLTDPARRSSNPWISLGVGGAALLAVYLAGVNRNLLYLSMLLSVAAMVSVLFSRWWSVLLGLCACVYLACVPARVEDLGALYPAPRNIPGAEKMWVTEIGEGETWTYQFTLGDLARDGRGAGMSGYLYVDGRNLSGLEIEMLGKTLNGSAYCGKKSGIDHVAIPLQIGTDSALTVSLRGDPGAHARIFHGPEVHGFDVYGDAVWLEFTGDRDRLIFHAKRTAGRPELGK